MKEKDLAKFLRFCSSVQNATRKHHFKVKWTIMAAQGCYWYKQKACLCCFWNWNWQARYSYHLWHFKHASTQGRIYEFLYVSQKWRHISVVISVTFFSGGVRGDAPPAFLHFEGTLEQNIEVLNDIFLERTSSFSTIISVQMKFDFHFAFYFILF